MKKPRITILAVFFILFSGVFLPGGQKAVIFPETGGPWCVVDEVIKGGQAEKLGLLPLDIILAINGRDVHNRGTLTAALEKAKDSAIHVDIFRDGRPSSIEGRLEGERLGIYANYVGVDKVLTPREMRTDLDLFFSSLTDIHPNIYANLSKEKFDAEKDRVYASLKTDLPVIEFWRLASSFVAKIGDGHTSLGLPSGDWGKRLYSGEKLVFPLVPFISQDGVLVRENLSAASIQKGDMIVAINGIPLEKILEEDERYTSGELRNFRLSLIEYHFPRMLFYIKGFHGPFKVSIRDAQGRLNDYEVQGTDKWSYDAAVAKLRDREFHFEEFPELRLGVIRFRNFVDAERFDAFLKNVFGTMKAKGYSFLVIDLQNNGGGNSAIAESLIDYITDRPYRTFGGAVLKIHAGVAKYYPKDTIGTVKTWADLDLRTPEKKENKFQGKVFVLIGPPTFSAASGFAAVIKDFNLGTLVGQETGGLPTCFGDVWNVALPNSGLELGVSWKYFIRPSGNPEYVLRGLLPDISVPTSSRDLLLGLNPALEKVKEIIRAEMKQESGNSENPAAPTQQSVFSFEPDERIFTAFAFMNAAGFDGEWNEQGMHPLRIRAREYLKKNLDQELLARMRAYYESHQAGSFAYYGRFALLLSAPPDLRLSDNSPPKKSLIEKFPGFPELLAEFYRRAKIATLWNELRPSIQTTIDEYAPFGQKALDDIIQYCRLEPDYFLEKAGRIVFNACPLMSYYTAFTDDINGDIYIVDGPSDRKPGPGAFYHEALHHVVNPLTASHLPEVQKLSELQPLAQEQLKGNYADWESLVNECFVRTIDHLLSGKFYQRSEDQIRERIENEYRMGFILCPALQESLKNYENSDESLRKYYPRLVSGLDIEKEKARWNRFWANQKKEPDQNEQKSAQETKKLTPEQLVEDVRQLAATIESTHPDPYVNGGGKIAFHRRFQQILRAIPEEGQSSVEFYRLLRPFVAAVGDAHTSIQLPGSGGSSVLRLPLGFEVVGKQIYLARVYSEEHRPLLGAVLLCVEGVPFSELMERQKKLQGYENEYGNLTNLMSSLGRRESLENLIPECRGKDRVTMKLRMPDGNSPDASIAFVDKLPEKRIMPVTKIQLPDFEKSDPVSGFLDTARKTAILRFGNMMGYREAMEYLASVADGKTAANWANYNYERFNKKKPPQDLQETIAGVPAATEVFRSLVIEMKKAGTETLLIDLRGNPGGNSFITDILMYFLYGWKVRNSVCVTVAISKYSELFFSNYKERTIETVGKYYAFPVVIGDYTFPEYRLEDQAEQEDLERYATFAAEKKSGAYDGFYRPKNIIVLTSARTMSSAYWLAADLSKAGAVLVGTPSGQAGNGFGDVLGFTLKNSGLSCGVSFRQFLKFPDDPEKGKLLRPDHELTYEKLASYDFDPNAEVLLALEVISQRGKN